LVFNVLLCSCLVPGATSLGEKGKSLALQHRSDETILVFKTDCDAFRTGVIGDRDSTTCDGLILVISKDNGSTILLVELKGTDLDHAVKQLETTLNVIRKKLPAGFDVMFRAVVVASGTASPKPSQEIKAQLKDKRCPLKVFKTKADDAQVRNFLNGDTTPDLSKHRARR